MKIALVTETFPPEVNGVAMTLHRLVSGIARRGHQIEVVRPRQSTKERSHDDGEFAEVICAGLPIFFYKGLHIGLPARHRLLKRWRAAPPDIIHIATEGPLGVSAAKAGRALGIPVLSSFHTNFHAYGNYYGVGLLMRLFLAYMRRFHNKTRATFVPSEDLRQKLSDDGFHNLKILGRGVSTRLFNPNRRDPELRRQWGVADDQPVAIYVGRIASEKNIPLTIEAFLEMREILPALKLVLVGDGPERPRLETAHPEFIFAGMQHGEALARHYASGDIFLFASITETFGNVVTEAMASGLAVLAYDYAAPAKYIRSGENGILAPFDDADKYREAARQLAHSPETWHTLGQAAYQTALSISWDAVIDGYLDNLREVLEQK